MLDDIVSLPDLEARAQASLPHAAWEWLASGAADEQTLRWNREAFDRLRLRPRVLRDVSTLDLRVTLFDRVHALPIVLAPVAYHRVLHPDGELATARGAGAAGVTWTVSTSATTAIEEIAAAATGPLWFQLYMQSDREFTRELVRRAEDAGCEALVLTVDTPVLGARDRQARAGFRLPPGVTTPHVDDDGRRRQLVMDSGHIPVTWRDVEWLRGVSRVPLLLKGVLDADDAAESIERGADGIIVSNHGARNLDTVPATMDALPAVVERVAGRVPVLVDGGVRRGTDVLKALALGAAAVLIGRPYACGLAVAGSDGVQHAVAILRRELEMAMRLTGRASLSAVDRSLLWDPPR